MAAGSTATWSSDGSTEDAGWTICAAPAPPTSSAYFSITSGYSFCGLSNNGQCVTTGPGDCAHPPAHSLARPSAAEEGHAACATIATVCLCVCVALRAMVVRALHLSVVPPRSFARIAYRACLVTLVTLVTLDGGDCRRQQRGLHFQGRAAPHTHRDELCYRGVLRQAHYRRHRLQRHHGPRRRAHGPGRHYCIVVVRRLWN